ncbi:hypothetical protein BDC45DRAFT_507653 [Circinella umbellata]|nr:hypothetical protein BDC45DRAFT_507653 [Circinella umbellata]
MATHNSDTEKHRNKCRQEIEKYIKERHSNDIAFGSFISENNAFVTENSYGLSDYKSFWTSLFGEVVAALNVKTVRARINWGLLEESINGEDEAACSTPKLASTSSKKSTDSKKSVSALLTVDQVNSFKEKFASMKDEEKWMIDGDFIENKMFEYGLTLSHEHSVHSFILDLEDTCWENVFSSSQLEYLKKHKCEPLPTASSEVLDFFHLFQKKHDINDLLRTAWEAGPYYQDSQFDVQWAQRTMIDLLTAYKYNIIEQIATSNSEKDLITRIWRLIDTVFDNTSVIATRNDKACVATAERLNAGRTISGNGANGWVTGWKPDLLLTKQEIEYGVAEHGGYDEACAGRKELFEKWLKLPKLIKDMFCRAARKVNYEKEYMRELKIAGFCHNHLRVSLVMMDCPEGYVCRLTRTRDYEIPLAIPQISKRLIPILKLVLGAKAMILKNVFLLEFGPEKQSDDELSEEPCFIVHEQSTSSQIFLPTSLNSSASQSKKRKTSEGTEN